MDPQQAKGMSPEVCAVKIINAVRKRREQVVIGPPVKYVTLIKRFMPGLFSMIIRKAKVT